MADKLNSNDDLAVIRSLTSPDGRSRLVMQGDGTLFFTGPVLLHVGQLAHREESSGVLPAQTISTIRH